MGKVKPRKISDPLVQLSSRGGVTLPAEVRKEMGLRSGDPLQVRVEDGKIVLEPVVVIPVERYSDERISEFQDESEMTADELSRVRQRWRMS